MSWIFDKYIFFYSIIFCDKFVDKLQRSEVCSASIFIFKNFNLKRIIMNKAMLLKYVGQDLLFFNI
uniref:Uncharacterized protein n=1 Tax=uncultured marine virus TaxID=186617 RepID=A0A0F7LBE0_9VIRU|nr:hypothetical protein [uncultured marine virus]